MDIQKVIEGINIHIESIADPAIKTVISKLLNVIELLAAENKQLREENQNLRDENNKLKGEQGKPDICKQTQSNKNISSEKERNQKNKKKNKRSKKKIGFQLIELRYVKLTKINYHLTQFLKDINLSWYKILLLNLITLNSRKKYIIQRF